MVNAHQEVSEKTPPSAHGQNQDETMPVPHPVHVLLMQAIDAQILQSRTRKLDILLSHPQICEGMLTQEQTAGLRIRG